MKSGRDRARRRKRRQVLTGAKMHIAVEGVKGVGATTAARLLADSLGVLFIEKPLQYLLGGRQSYERLSQKINDQPSDNLRAWFYGLGHLYFSRYLADQHVVTDGYFARNFARNSSESNLALFDALAKQIRPPDFTFLLTAEPDALRARRIRTEASGRTQSLDAVPETDTRYRECFRRYGFPYAAIDTSGLDPAEVAETMQRILRARGIDAG